MHDTHQHHRHMEPAAEPASHARAGHEHHDHARMVADFKQRFWLCLILTVPVLLLSPTGSGHAFGPIGAWTFPGSRWLLLALGSFAYFYGGWPFLAGLRSELAKARPGMMTLIALAISV